MRVLSKKRQPLQHLSVLYPHYYAQLHAYVCRVTGVDGIEKR
jgi:hypothetical protein